MNFCLDDYREMMSCKMSKWIGRQIEYRSGLSLLNDQYRYRSTVIGTYVNRSVFVKVTHRNKLNVSINRTVRKRKSDGAMYYSDNHHKTTCEVNHSGWRHSLWENVNDDIYHVVELSKTRWKQDPCTGFWLGGKSYSITDIGKIMKESNEQCKAIFLQNM